MFRCVVSLSVFASCAVFWRARRASQNTNNEWKFSVILHNKTSNKRFIIQQAKLFYLWGRISRILIYLWGRISRILVYRECVTDACGRELAREIQLTDWWTVAEQGKLVFMVSTTPSLAQFISLFTTGKKSSFDRLNYRSIHYSCFSLWDFSEEKT